MSGHTVPLQTVLLCILFVACRAGPFAALMYRLFVSVSCTPRGKGSPTIRDVTDPQHPRLALHDVVAINVLMVTIWLSLDVAMEPIVVVT